MSSRARAEPTSQGLGVTKHPSAWSRWNRANRTSHTVSESSCRHSDHALPPAGALAHLGMLHTHLLESGGKDLGVAGGQPVTGALGEPLLHDHQPPTGLEHADRLGEP